MKKSTLFAAAALAFSPVFAFGQRLFGEVLDIEKKPLAGAVVGWSGSTIGARADDAGQFSIPLPLDTSKMPLRLVAFFGGARDTFLIDEFVSFWTLPMSVQVTMAEVTVRDEKTGAFISVLQPIKTEIITRAELSKAACCDLAGCFETQSTVQPTTTNVLTNAKELRILGLSGVYNQVLVDGLPLIQGLAHTYGTGAIPGAMVENIWVVKGANSVLQGYESMVGQITVFPREGGNAEPLTADALVNSFGETHLNAGFSAQKGRSTNYLAAHLSLPGGRWDRDGDRFLDLPLLRRASFYDKWRFRKENEKGWSAFVAARFVDESRTGGQVDFDRKKDIGTTRAYGQTVDFCQTDLATKTGFRFDENRKISLLASFSAHEQASNFGLTRYDASQRSFYANLQFELFWGQKRAHDLKTGASFRHLTIFEDIAFAAADTLNRTFSGRFEQKERIGGLFAENTFRFRDDRWTWIAGARADFLPSDGWRFVPRTMLRFSPSEKFDLRASAGTGWRTVRLFSENVGLLVGARDLVFAEKLRPEAAWNAGFNATRRFKIRKAAMTATADFYQTRFQNQFFPDYDADPNLAVIANFEGRSVSNGLQIEASAAWSRRLELRAAYNFLDVWRADEAGEKVLLPFNPRHKWLGVATFRTADERWQFDANVHRYGRQRLPDTRKNPVELRLPDFSEAFEILSLQIRHDRGDVAFFAGCENVFNFRQSRPLLGWERPFSRGFDPAFAWGPTRGREFYAGLNFKMARKKAGTATN